MGKWATQRGPEVALKYWALKPEATMRDVVLQVRSSCITRCSAACTMMQPANAAPAYELYAVSFVLEVPSLCATRVPALWAHCDHLTCRLMP